MGRQGGAIGVLAHPLSRGVVLSQQLRRFDFRAFRGLVGVALPLGF